ncbi:MAG: Yip1 family protein [Pseudomonadota bacterium]
MVDKNELQAHADGIMTRAKNILTAPVETWEVIAKETDEPMQVFLKYALPLIAIGPIATFIGGLVFGYGGIFGVTIRPSFTFLLSTMITTFVLGLLSVWILAFIANLMSKQFEGRDDFAAAFRLVAYS